VLLNPYVPLPLLGPDLVLAPRVVPRRPILGFELLNLIWTKIKRGKAVEKRSVLGCHHYQQTVVPGSRAIVSIDNDD